MGFNEFIGKLFGNKQTRDIKEIQPWVEKIKAAFDETVTDGYTIDIGRYSKYRPSLHDYRSA